MPVARLMPPARLERGRCGREAPRARLYVAKVETRRWRVSTILMVAGFLWHCFTPTCEAQTAGKYEFYRYKQHYAISIDPLGQILGRVSAAFEQRLDPNFTREYEIVYQRNLEDRHLTGAYPESGISVGAIERIFLVDNAAMLGQYVGVGAGLGIVNKTISVRLTAEMGYKFAFGGGIGHYFIEPRIIMDAYLVTNHDGQRVLPYISIPFGYAWW